MHGATGMGKAGALKEHQLQGEVGVCVCVCMCVCVWLGPAPGLVGAVDCDFAPPVGSNADPLYTFNCPTAVSIQSSPVKGADGADVPAEFSNSFTRFSLRPSPNPEKLFPKSCTDVVLSTVPSVIVAITDPSVLLIVYAICLYL